MFVCAWAGAWRVEPVINALVYTDEEIRQKKYGIASWWKWSIIPASVFNFPNGYAFTSTPARIFCCRWCRSVQAHCPHTAKKPRRPSNSVNGSLDMDVVMLIARTTMHRRRKTENAIKQIRNKIHYTISNNYNYFSLSLRRRRLRFILISPAFIAGTVLALWVWALKSPFLMGLIFRLSRILRHYS